MMAFLLHHNFQLQARALNSSSSSSNGINNHHGALNSSTSSTGSSNGSTGMNSSNGFGTILNNPQRSPQKKASFNHFDDSFPLDSPNPYKSKYLDEDEFKYTSSWSIMDNEELIFEIEIE